MKLEFITDFHLAPGPAHHTPVSGLLVEMLPLDLVLRIDTGAIKRTRVRSSCCRRDFLRASARFARPLRCTCFTEAGELTQAAADEFWVNPSWRSDALSTAFAAAMNPLEAVLAAAQVTAEIDPLLTAVEKSFSQPIDGRVWGSSKQNRHGESPRTEEFLKRKEELWQWAALPSFLDDVAKLEDGPEE